MLLICLASASFAQSALGPPQDLVHKEIVETDVDKTMSVTLAYNPEIQGVCISRTGEYNPGRDGTVLSIQSGEDLSVSGSPITTSGTFTLNINKSAVTYAKIPYNTGPSLLPQRSKQYPSASLTYAHTYNWNPGYVGWQR